MWWGRWIGKLYIAETSPGIGDCHSHTWRCIEEHRNEAHRHHRAGVENRGAAVTSEPVVNDTRKVLQIWRKLWFRWNNSTIKTVLSTGVHFQFLKNAASCVGCTLRLPVLLCFHLCSWDNLHWNQLVFRFLRGELCSSIFSVFSKMSEMQPYCFLSSPLNSW